MQTRFLLLRHAETTHPHVFNGFESDVPLSPRGERQTQAVVPLLAAAAPHVIVSSAMLRAVQTAQPLVAACGVPHRVEPDLHERKVGEMSGMTHAEAGELWTGTLRRWKQGELSYSPPGAESYLDVQRRVVPVLNRLADEYRGQTLIVIAHGHVCRVLLFSLVEGMSMASWEEIGPIPNLAITELVHSGHTWKAIRINDLPEEVGRVNGVDL